MEKKGGKWEFFSRLGKGDWRISWEKFLKKNSLEEIPIKGKNPGKTMEKMSIFVD